MTKRKGSSTPSGHGPDLRLRGRSEITRRTLASRQDSLRLTRVLAEGGSTSLLDVRQSEQLVFTAGSEVPSLEQQIDQQENFISILLGNDPAAVGATVRTQRPARQSLIDFA